MGQEVRKLLYQRHNPYDGVEIKPFNTHGWNQYSPAFKDAITITDPLKLVVEVGTWMGASSRTMGELIKQKGVKDFEIVCVDTFLGSVEHWTREAYLLTFTNGMPDIYNQFLSNTLHAGLQENITPFPCDSVNAALVMEKFNIAPDLIYIDAGHDFDSVSADIRRWSKILRPGGTLLLDDGVHPPVKQAVELLIPTATQVSEKFIWIKK